ncbi:MAG: reverse transcriptase family protein [Planctomycetota bacterium]|nr:reverse transcriptase family protein [Planctomycetota bacterium]
MSLGKIILQLKEMTEDLDANWTKIFALLERHSDLAEAEVARHYLSEAIEGEIRRRLESENPNDKLDGLRAVESMFPAAVAAKLLRHMVKDPNRSVRALARKITLSMGIEDVALRDTRAVLPRRVTASVAGGYNPTGWSFGLFRSVTTRWGHRYWASGVQPPLAPESERQALPAIADPKALAHFLGCNSETELFRFMRPGSRTGAPYVDFEVPKAKGGTRLISAPRAPLRKIQRTILSGILEKLPVHDAAHGFVKGRSTVTNAAPHLKAALVIKMDLKNFFPTIHYRRIRGLFQHYGYNAKVAGMLASLCTRRPILEDGTVVWPGVMPQGAPTSPSLANLICRRLDARLTGLAKRVKATYTRYADDLTFSFAKDEDVAVGRFFWWVDQICQQEGFAEHPKKRRVLRPNRQQRICGVVVNEKLTIPRKERRRFRAILHNCRKHGLASQARGKDDFKDYLRGYASYVKMVQPELGAQLEAEVKEILASA